MIRFVEKYLPDYIVNDKVEDWGLKYYDEKPPCLTRAEFKEYKRTKIMPQNKRGQPRHEPMQCIICGTVRFQRSKLWEHVFATHLTGEYQEKCKDRHGYYCPVAGCGIRYDKSRWLYNKHMGPEGPHSVAELLEAGVEPWKAKRISEEEVADIATWLSENNLILLNDDQESDNEVEEEEQIDEDDEQRPVVNQANQTQPRTETFGYVSDEDAIANTSTKASTVGEWFNRGRG